jgi:uncharacterized protein (DUF1810 family)
MLNGLFREASLNRFVRAQKTTYSIALQEIESGRKRTCWMWYIFPQLKGLGSSKMSRRYSIKSINEAVAYLSHPVLGARLRETFTVLLSVRGKTVTQIFGDTDSVKLQSSATLFAYVSSVNSVFRRVLDKYFEGELDVATLNLLRK